VVNVNIVVNVDLSGVILAMYKNCFKIEGIPKIVVQVTKIEKRQRDNGKAQRNKDGQGWRRLTWIANHEL